MNLNFLFFVRQKNIGVLLQRLKNILGPVLTIYNTFILVRSVIKFLNRNFLFIEKVQAFLE